MNEHNIRRKERAVTDAAAIESFIAKEQFMRVAFYDDGEIYIVPLNYGYRCENGQYCFYFHGAKAGRKYGLATKNPAVGFEIDGAYALISADTACGHSAKYMSVIGTGKLRIIENFNEKLQGLRCIMQQTTGKADWAFDDESVERTAVFQLDADTLTCKAK